VNTGAIRCLASVQALLDRCGFVLINDYGPTSAEQSAAYTATQNFGRTTAQGLNFPVLDSILSRNQWHVGAPAGDPERSIHSRLLLLSDLPRTLASFQDRFSAQAQSHFETPPAEARDHSTAGRKEQALECFRTAVARAPRDWRVLGEAAEFVGLELKDFAAGVELAQAAVEINPWYSSWLWNVLGDCLFCCERYADAHEAYRQAERVNPSDARTNLNLAYTWLHFGDFERALRAIATGLLAPGPYRSRLLEKQAAILAALDAKRSGEYDRSMLRMGRLQFRKAAESTARAAT
jgi:tetratricopeptide (TPR) repeat protein